MRPIRTLGVLALLAAVLVGAAAAQESALVAEAHVGAAVPVGSLATGDREGEGATAALSFGVDFALPGGSRWVPYVGFSQHRFGCVDAGCAEGEPYVATGFHGGYRIVPFPGRAVLESAARPSPEELSCGSHTPSR